MAAYLSSVFVAESHKALQAIICDILFPCADYAISEAQEKPRTDLLCQKKKQWEHDGSKSASKIEVTVRSCSEKQFEKKKTLREALKFFDCCVSVRRQIQPSYKKIIRPHYVFALFGFVEVKKFRDSGEISD